MAKTQERSELLFQKLERDLLKLASKPRAENVHRFRTGARRLQTLLEQIAPQPSRRQQKLLKMLARIRKRAGRLRDVDVQMSALRSLKFPQEPRRKTQLTHHLIELRGPYEKKMRKALDQATVREIRKRLKRAARDFRLDTGCDPLAIARQMLGQVGRVDAPITEELLHQYRILGKRARYAAEFAPKSAAAAQFLTSLERMQDALGDWHDWLMLTQTARDLLGDVRESPLVAELHNVTGAKFRHAVAVLGQVRQTLGHAKTPPAVHAPVRSTAAARDAVSAA